MPRLLYTVQNLIDETRAQLDETNIDSIDDTRDVLPALNRANDYAFDVYARKYPEPILAYTSLDLQSNVSEYDIPETVFEDRILRIEITIPSGSGNATYREVQQISYSDLTNYESSSTTNIPVYYAIIGRKIRFVSAPTGAYDCRLWYLRNPEKLVLPQGRITVVNSASNYVVVDELGTSLTTETDQLGSYVNVIDGQTGEIKGTLQIQATNSLNRVTFRASPIRSSVLNRAVSGDLSEISVELDDYLSPVDGTCVPYFGRPTTNFLIQYAVVELGRKLGSSGQNEEDALAKFERQIERTFSRRPQQLRVRKRNKIWNYPVRRLYYE